MSNKISHVFQSPVEILQFINREVMKYTGCFDKTRVLYSYNRMTTEELGMEVYLKILKSVQTKGLNKTYIRQAVMFICIDEYRRKSDHDTSEKFSGTQMNEPLSSNGQGYVSAEETFGLTERLMALKIFEPKERAVVLLLIEGKRNPEVREELGIPKMSYYTLLKRIKNKYVGYLESYGDDVIDDSEQALRDIM